MREFGRYILIGPCLGACIGLAQTAIAAAVWTRQGQPDFYFRGWSGVEVSFILQGIAGAIAGVLFAALVATGERLLRRRVSAFPASASAVMVAVAVAWVVVEVEFARRELLPQFTLEGAAVAVASISMLSWSRAEKTESLSSPAVLR